MARSRGATSAPPALSAGQLVAGQSYHLECSYLDDGSVAYLERFTHGPGSGPSVDAIARQVYQSVPLVYPQPHTAPPIDGPQLVGFPIWMWVDDAVWRDFDASASLAGVTVTVVARPKHVLWEMGDGRSVTCGRGTAWIPNGPAGQRTDCSYYYQFVSDEEPGGKYPASVTVVWSVTWSASTGESGSLPDASRSTSFSLDVNERQAVITYGDTG